MAEIVKITKDGVIQYPITKPEAVIDENGKNVLQLIRENGGSYDDTDIKKDISDLKENDALQDAELAKLSEKVNELDKGEAYIMGDTLTFRNWADASIEGETLKL